jgi:hypothetical protein
MDGLATMMQRLTDQACEVAEMDALSCLRSY